MRWLGWPTTSTLCVPGWVVEAKLSGCRIRKVENIASYEDLPVCPMKGGNMACNITMSVVAVALVLFVNSVV